MTFTQALSTNNYGPAKFIVAPSAANGTHTTIAGALTSASSGDTIFIRPGTYTENPTLKAGVNLTAYNCDSLTPNVVINGKCTLTGAGSVSCSGISFQTNSDYFLAVTGSAASIVNLFNCNLNCLNNTGIDFTSSSSSAAVSLYYCTGNIGTTGIGLFTNSSAGSLSLEYCVIGNTGASTTASTTSTAMVGIGSCSLSMPFSCSSTGSYNIFNSVINTSATNTITLTTAGTGTSVLQNSSIFSGTAACITIGAGSALGAINNIVSSSNATAVITGAGSLTYSGIYFGGTGKVINTTTLTGGIISGGLVQTPSAGFIGERIASAVTGHTPSNNTPTTLTSIALTAGVWDISAFTDFAFSGAATIALANISTTNNAITGNVGDAYSSVQAASIGSNQFVSIPCFRVVLTSNATYYLVVQANFSTGAATVGGRISAVRTG